MSRPQHRVFETADQKAIDAVLAELRAHFHEWSQGLDHEHDLIGFAFYEGCGGQSCCGDILARAAPLAVGKELVKKHGFEWVMMRASEGWNPAVIHPASGLFIDLQELENGVFLDDPYRHAAEPGRATHESYEAIVRQIQKASRGRS